MSFDTLSFYICKDNFELLLIYIPYIIYIAFLLDIACAKYYLCLRY